MLVISFYHHISFLSDASPIIAFTLSLAHLTMLLPTPIDILEILKSKNSFRFMFILSSPRAKPAESARAFTGRRNSHSERGEDFLTGQLNFFTETAVTPERKVEKSFPRWEIFGPKKSAHVSSSPCSGNDRKKLFREKKVPLPK